LAAADGGARPPPREPATVLVVDDEPLNVDLLQQELAEAGYRTLAAGGGEEAIALAASRRPELILLDVVMRGIDGYETCRRLKADEATRAIPVIFLTAAGESWQKLRAFRAGAVDHVTKPFESEELLARVGVHVALRREIEAHRRSRATIGVLVDELRGESGAMVGNSPALAQVRAQIVQVGPTDTTVLVEGETGTGKELVARALHDASPRRERALVKINCAALPRDLVESELFGHEKGAFTGALQQRRGRFELADGGTLFLDEVGELPPDTQAKLLRALQEQEFERVGGSRSLKVDVRVVAATNRDLRDEVAAGRFRADLYYRLAVFPIRLPPLRERPSDIAALLAHFAARAARRLGKPGGALPPAFVERALAYRWPGNIRELQNVVERHAITGEVSGFDGGGMPAAVARARPLQDAIETLEQVERQHIVAVLERLRWVIEGGAGAAVALGLNPSTLRGRLRKLGIRKPG